MAEHTAPARRRSGDHGFTLPEVLITIAIMGLVIGALTMTFGVIVKTQPSNEARADDARSLLGLSTWLPADASSTPMVPESEASAHWNTAPGTASGCADSSGNNVLTLRWSETINGSSAAYHASYRIVQDNGWFLIRIACGPDGSSRAAVTGELPGASAVEPHLIVRDGMVRGASITVNTADGARLRVDANSNNPNEQLGDVPEAVPGPTTPIEPNPPPTTEPTDTSTTVPADPDPNHTTTTTTPTTTTPTTTTTTTVPCTASIAAVSPDPVRNQQGSGAGGSNQVVGPLRDPVNVDVNRSGGCSALGLEYVPDPAVVPATVRWRLFGDSVRVTLESVDTERWRDGGRTLVLRDGQDGPVLATYTLTVQ